MSELMGSAAHLHFSAYGKDIIVIIQMMDLSGALRSGFVMGDEINLSFGGNVAHIFDKASGLNLEQ